MSALGYCRVFASPPADPDRIYVSAAFRERDYFAEPVPGATVCALVHADEYDRDRAALELVRALARQYVALWPKQLVPAEGTVADVGWQMAHAALGDGPDAHGSGGGGT